MKIKIALAGNPNCGKTTLFNALTGSNQYVGNWPGVTVEKKEGKLKKNGDIILTDLPGIYSLSPYTLEEVVARNYLIDEKPDAILNIIDGTNIERNLYLTTQLIEMGIPVVCAINMMDIVRKNGDKIDIQALSKILGCRVVEISALKGTGIEEAADAAIEAAKEGRKVPRHIFCGTVEHTLAHIEEAAVHHMPEEQQRWYAVKIFERDEKVLEQLKLDSRILEHIEVDIRRLETELDDDAESIITNERYVYITGFIKDCCKKKHAGRLTVSDRIDQIATNRFLALPFFAAVMFVVYTLSIGTVGEWSTTFMNDGLFGSFKGLDPEFFGASLLSHFYSIPELFDMVLLKDGVPVVADWLYSLIMDGVIGGVGSVLGFVPQMIVLFLLLSILEDCGYMSRVAFIMDKIFHHFGLSGKSFIPLLVASGCSVPGIMASRTIENERDRKITIMTTAFVPCGAKMPIVGFIAAALFGGSPLIATAAYFIGIASVIVSGIILKKFKSLASEPSPFVMELPAYHAPLASNVLRTTWERGWSFIKRAGTVIFAASVIIWTLNSLSFDGGFHYIGESDAKSILSMIGEIIANLFAPLGFDSWQAAVATVLGLVAKEEVVGVFGSLSSMADADLAFEVAESGATDLAKIVAKEFFGSNVLSAFSFMTFNLLCAPCFAAMGAIRREMNSGKWTAAAIGYMTAFAYAVSLMIYQFGTFFTTGTFTVWTALAVVVLAVFIYLIFRKNKYVKQK